MNRSILVSDDRFKLDNEAHCEMVQLTQFRSQIIPFVPIATELEMLNATRRACILFCQKTRVWQMQLPSQDLIVNKTVYELHLPHDALLTLVMSVMLDVDMNQHIIHARSEQSPTINGQSYTIDTHTPPKLILSSEPKTFIEDGLNVKVAMHPTHDSILVPAILLNDYAHEITIGTISNLTGMMGKDYYDFSKSKELAIYFMELSLAARDRIANNYVREPRYSQGCFV